VLKYYYDLGLDTPNDDSRFLYNQVKFATSNQSNQTYAFMVPRIKTVDDNNNLYYLTQSQKADIINRAAEQKILNTDIIPQDPIYTGVTVGLELTTESPSLDDIDDTYIVIERMLSDRISTTKIQHLVSSIFINTFDSDNVTLGQTININQITADILDIESVRRIKTRRVDSNTGETLREIPFLNIYTFNVVYPDVDIVSSGSNISLPYFKYPFLYNQTLKNRIIVEVVDS